MPGAWGNPLLPQNRPGAGSQGLLEPHSPRWEVGKPAHTSLSVVTSSRRQDDLATWLPLQPPSLTQAEGADSAALERPAPPSPPGVRCPHPSLLLFRKPRGPRVPDKLLSQHPVEEQNLGAAYGRRGRQGGLSAARERPLPPTRGVAWTSGFSARPLLAGFVGMGGPEGAV